MVKGALGSPGSIARCHDRVVNKARIAPEPAAYAQRSCAAVRAFLRPRDRSWGFRSHGDGVRSSVPENSQKPGICRAISQVLLHMDGYGVTQDLGLQSRNWPECVERRMRTTRSTLNPGNSGFLSKTDTGWSPLAACQEAHSANTGLVLR
jgi:hypothetical protein